jgi:hypothetical protein
MKTSPYAITIFLLIALVCPAARAQEDAPVRIKLKPKVEEAPRPNPTPRPRPKNPSPRPVETGSLVVASAAGAMLTLDLIDGDDTREGKVPAGSGFYQFPDLKPGRYRIRAEMEGHAPAEDTVQIVARKNSNTMLNLRPITYQVTIRANVNEGEVRYRRAKAPDEIPQVAQFNLGRATLPNLRAGEYEVDIRPREGSYETLLAIIEVGNSKTEFPVELKRRISEETFSEIWRRLDGWEAPAGWGVGAGKLLIKGAGVALPRDENYRRYADFDLVSDVRMVNGMAVSFALRAQDQRNYYLVQLTGAQSDEPYVLRGFVVRNGERRPMQPSISIEAFAKSLTGNFFTVALKVIANRINVSINDSQTGDEQSLGILTDRDRNFTAGAVGLAAQGLEQNEVARFIVKPVTTVSR